MNSRRRKRGLNISGSFPHIHLICIAGTPRRAAVVIWVLFAKFNRPEKRRLCLSCMRICLCVLGVFVFVEVWLVCLYICIFLCMFVALCICACACWCLSICVCMCLDTWVCKCGFVFINVFFNYYFHDIHPDHHLNSVRATNTGGYIYVDVDGRILFIPLFCVQCNYTVQTCAIVCRAINGLCIGKRGWFCSYLGGNLSVG